MRDWLSGNCVIAWLPRWLSSKESACQFRSCRRQVQSLGGEDPLEEEMATHSSLLVWKILWTEEPGGLQSMGSQRVGYNWAHTHQILFNILCLVVEQSLCHYSFIHTSYFLIEQLSVRQCSRHRGVTGELLSSHRLSSWNLQSESCMNVRVLPGWRGLTWISMSEKNQGEIRAEEPIFC